MARGTVPQINVNVNHSYCVANSSNTLATSTKASVITTIPKKEKTAANKELSLPDARYYARHLILLLAPVNNVVRSLTETVTISDGLTRLAAKTRTATETVTISSTVARLAAK